MFVKKLFALQQNNSVLNWLQICILGMSIAKPLDFQEVVVVMALNSSIDDGSY